ncbi:TPA: hypothetical protein ACH3X2_000771 [Trebouxia sp. C0005]
MSRRSSLLMATVLCASLLLAASNAEPLQNQGRRLLTSFYTDPDTNYQSSTLVDVDTTYKSRSYTTETQRAKVARYAQAAAVAAAGQIPDMNSTLAMEQVGSNNSALMDSYAQKMTDAASSASNTSTADTTAATAAVASTESVATAAVASTESVKPLQESTQQSPESPAQGFLHLTSFKDWVNETASEVGDAVSGAAKKVEEKVKGSPSPSPTPSPSTAAVAAVQSAHSQLYHRGAHTAKVTSSDAIGGPIQLYNPYQSSDYDTKQHPASAAMDGDIATSSQTAVDTKSCTKLNEEGLYGTCGVIGECMSSPYYTGAYASTPNYPYWTAGFSSDISVSYRVTHVVLSARQDCCRCPLAGAKIYIGDPSALNLASNENPDLSTESNWQLCATVPSFTTDSPPLIFSESADYTETFLCSQSLVGQAVAIQVPAYTTILTLAEVQVVGLQV